MLSLYVRTQFVPCNFNSGALLILANRFYVAVIAADPATGGLQKNTLYEELAAASIYVIKV